MKTAWIPDLIWLQEVPLPMWSGWESRRTPNGGGWAAGPDTGEKLTKLLLKI